MATWTLRQVVATAPMLTLTSPNVGGVTALRSLEFNVTLPTAPTAGQVIIWRTDGDIVDMGGPGRGYVIRADQIAAQNIKLLMDPFDPGPHLCTIELRASDGTTPIYPISAPCTFNVLTTPPVVSDVNKTVVTGTTAGFTFSTDQDNGIAYYVACNVAQPSITFAQVKAGHDQSNAPATFAGSQTITTVGAHTDTATGLPTMTTIFLYVIQENAVGLQSNIGRASWGQGNTLLTGLESYWKLDEASGNAIDAHGTNTLTPEGTGTLGTAPGVINGGRDFEYDNQHGLWCADNPSVSTGDITFGFSVWYKPEELSNHHNIVGKWSGPDQYEYGLLWNTVTDRITFYVTHNGATSAGIDSVVTVTPGQLYHIVPQHDATGNVLRLSVNDVASTPVAHSLGVFNGAARFHIGAKDAYYTNNNADGVIDECGFWKNRLLTPYDITTLYAEGDGLPYSEFA